MGFFQILETNFEVKQQKYNLIWEKEVLENVLKKIILKSNSYYSNQQSIAFLSFLKELILSFLYVSYKLGKKF